MSVKLHGQPLGGSSSKLKPNPHAADYGEHLESKPVMGVVSKHTKTQGGEEIETSQEEVVAPGIMGKKGTLAELYVEGGRTVNLGNYESARITVGLRMPCLASEIDSAYEFCQEWVSKRLEEAQK